MSEAKVDNAPETSDSNIALDLLDASHPLRNKPLGKIFAEYRNNHGKQWKGVNGMKIDTATFNELGEVWHSNNKFRVVSRSND